jgi:Protein of unknown function (DUF3485)
MSLGLDSPVATAPVGAAEDLPAPLPARPGVGLVGLWARVGLAVALLAASAAGRAWQAHRVDQRLRDGRIAPFAVAELPKTLGPWIGSEIKMDPVIARVTGSTEQTQRVYQNRITGQKVEMIFLFGPSTEMFIHAPETCYPAAGYTRVAGPVPHQIAAPGDAPPWPFEELVYAKGEGGTADQQEVYFSWRYAGKWSPGMMTRKVSERIPGMFKVQVARPIQDRELDVRGVGNPCEAFLTYLMPEIDRRIAQGQAAQGRK